MRKKEGRSQRQKIDYTELNKAANKKRRQRSRKKRTDHVETILQSGIGPNHIYMGGPKKKICEIKNEETKIQTDRNEILKICTRFYTELYSSAPKDQHPSLKITNSDSSEVPPILTPAVKKTLKEMKNNKAPGIDNLTSDTMILRGEESVKQLTKIIHQILETKKIPAEWKEAKMIILHKKGDTTDIKNYRPISPLSHMYKLFTRILQKRMEKVSELKPTKRTEKVIQLLTTSKQSISC